MNFKAARGITKQCKVRLFNWYMSMCRDYKHTEDLEAGV